MSKNTKNALVVGVGPGLGGAAALRLAADGYQVALAARNVDKLSEFAAESGGLAVAMDATDPSSIEEAAPLIRAAESWKQLHQQLAAQGMRYERKGSGAIVWVGDVAVKASAVDRSASFGKLEQLLTRSPDDAFEFDIAHTKRWS